MAASITVFGPSRDMAELTIIDGYLPSRAWGLR